MTAVARQKTCGGFIASRGYASEFLQFAKEIGGQMAPLVNVLLEVERLGKTVCKGGKMRSASAQDGSMEQVKSPSVWMSYRQA